MSFAIKPTGDRKTRFWPGQRNTYGLLPGLPAMGGTCPHATVGKGGCCHLAKGRKNPTCYVFNTMSCFKGVKPVLEQNTQLLQSLPIADQIRVLSDEFQRFYDCEKRRAKPSLHYRLHWSGDIYDAQYAMALVTAMNDFPQINFWCYTRSYPVAAHVADNTPNLNLYLSIDPDNTYQMLRTYFDWQAHQRHSNMQICYMSKENDFEAAYERAYWQHQVAITAATVSGKQLIQWPKEAPQLRVCPVDAGKLALEEGCSKCMGCIKKNPMPVWFAS